MISDSDKLTQTTIIINFIDTIQLWLFNQFINLAPKHMPQALFYISRMHNLNLTVTTCVHDTKQWLKKFASLYTCRAIFNSSSI